MMTREEELEKMREERDMLENDLEYFYDTMKSIERETDLYEENYEWNQALDESHNVENAIAYLTSYIEELEAE